MTLQITPRVEFTPWMEFTPWVESQRLIAIRFVCLRQVADASLARIFRGLSCRQSTPRQQRHAMLNDATWRAIRRARYQLTRNL